ncbi:hypothetical protein LIER_13189 [Lithospermum erythrorhizon]|uniref:RNA-directed DNA polymerase from mobile element jockey n=1 Tax=Lithospermum erythrorhizon TaxID=34254 RepID=A0AAV3PWJ7_LITER
MIFKVGIGFNIIIWKDNWIPGFDSQDLDDYFNTDACSRLPLLVSDLFIDNLYWNTPLISSIFPQYILTSILKIRLSGEDDCKVWPNKNFTTKDLYSKLSDKSLQTPLLPTAYTLIPSSTWNKLWNDVIFNQAAPSISRGLDQARKFALEWLHRSKRAKAFFRKSKQEKQFSKL